MIPKSLTKLGEAASLYSIAESSRYPVEGDDWLPPLLGSWSGNIGTSVEMNGGEREFTEKEEKELLSDSEDDENSTSLSRRSSFSSRSDSSTITSTSSKNDSVAPSSKKIVTPETIQSVLDEIRSVTSKLAALESSLTSGSSTSSSTSSSLSNSWLGSLIYSSSPSSSSSSPSVGTTTTTTTAAAAAGTTIKSKSLFQSIKDDYPISVGAASATLATGVAVGLIGLWGKRRR